MSVRVRLPANFMADQDYKKLDYWTLKAKKEGYPARSVYKLEELQKKYKIIKPFGKVLDVGASPGSWSLYVSKIILKGNGLVVSCDLKPLSLSPIPNNIEFILGDAFSKENLEKIKSFGEFDTIISDAAPSTTGNRITDTSRSFELVDNILELSKSCAKQSSSICIKFFQGSENKVLIEKAKSIYKKVVIHKPEACRVSSFETYIVGIDKK